MIGRGRSGGFFANNWHWAAMAAGIALLLGALAAFFMNTDLDPQEEAADALSRLDTLKSRRDTGVKALETGPFVVASKIAGNPPTLGEVEDAKGSYLVSKGRVFCAACERAIPEKAEKCAFCGVEQPKEELVKLDTDGDGMPDEYERKHGLDPAADDRELDKDGDGFSNNEEFAAGTDPADPKSHPPYIESLKLAADAVKETTLPFYFEKILPLPGGKYRYFFRDLTKKDAYGNTGLVYKVLEGEEIGKRGFVVKGYTEKKEKKAIKGGNGMEREEDLSEATIERKKDGRVIVLRIGERRKPVDVQAKLVYERRGTKEYTVVPGDVIELNGEKYKVKTVEKLGVGGKVTIEDLATGKISILKGT